MSDGAIAVVDPVDAAIVSWIGEGSVTWTPLDDDDAMSVHQEQAFRLITRKGFVETKAMVTVLVEGCTERLDLGLVLSGNYRCAEEVESAIKPFYPRSWFNVFGRLRTEPRKKLRLTHFRLTALGNELRTETLSGNPWRLIGMTWDPDRFFAEPRVSVHEDCRFDGAESHGRVIAAAQAIAKVGDIHIMNPAPVVNIAVAPFAAPTTEPQLRKETHEIATHSEDFRSVLWFGASYSFTGNQAPVIARLWKAWENGTPDVGDETLLAAVDPESPPRSLRDLFRGSPAWNTLVVEGGSKGSHRLCESK